METKVKYLCVKQPSYSSDLFGRFTKGNTYISICNNPYYIKDDNGDGRAFSCDEIELNEYFQKI